MGRINGMSWKQWNELESVEWGWNQRNVLET